MRDFASARVTDDPSRCAQILADTYASVFVDEDLCLPKVSEKTVNELTYLIFTPDQLLKKLKSCRNFASPGSDQIPYFIIKKGGQVMLELLCRFFQLLLDIGEVPCEWKCATVIPFFKKGSRSDPSNYRPISLTCTIGKLMESCLASAIWKFWTANSLIRPSQFGFVPNGSCPSQLLEFLEDVTSFVDRGNWADVIYLDFSKAFNTVPHKRLMLKLSSLGIKGKMYNWLQNFLENRYEVVKIKDFSSRPYLMRSGVPQGSVLGPLMFTAYVNDIEESVSYSSVLKYADDIKLYIELKKNCPHLSHSALQLDLNSVSAWLNTWQLSVNVAKCATLHLGHGNPGYDYVINTQKIEEATHQRDLGVLISDNLKFSAHTATIVARAESVLQAMKKTIASRDPQIWIKIFTHHVRPLLEYATTVWNPHNVKDKHLVERVQRRATKLVCNMRNLSYEERLLNLGLETLEKRRLLADMVEVYKIVHGLSCSDSSRFFVENQLSSTRGHLFKFFLPASRLDVRRHFFSVRVVEVWNGLPNDVVSSSNLKSFKKGLAQHLNLK